MSPRSKQLSERMKAESRHAILSSALELFARKGFSATTTEEIARRARVSKGLVFSHFPTKLDLLVSIIDENIQRWFPEQDNQAGRRSAQERFTSLMESWLGLIRAEPNLVRLGLQLNLDDTYRKLITKKGGELIQRYLGGVQELLEELGSDEPELDCYLLMFFFDGVTANYTVAPDLFPIDAIKDHFVRMLLSQWKKRV
jgi:AcrR family transcriptional regulator